MLYIPFIHSRHNAKGTSLGVGRDIICEPRPPRSDVHSLLWP